MINKGAYKILSEETKNENDSTLKHVYVIKNQFGMTKIGIAKDIRRRMNELRLTGGVEISEGWFSEPKCNAYLIEQTLHRIYQSSRKQGEWFEGAGHENYVEGTLNFVEGNWQKFFYFKRGRSFKIFLDGEPVKTVKQHNAEKKLQYERDKQEEKIKKQKEETYKKHQTLHNDHLVHYSDYEKLRISIIKKVVAPLPAEKIIFSNESSLTASKLMFGYVTKKNKYIIARWNWIVKKLPANPFIELYKHGFIEYECPSIAIGSNKDSHKHLITFKIKDNYPPEECIMHGKLILQTKLIKETDFYVKKLLMRMSKDNLLPNFDIVLKRRISGNEIVNGLLSSKKLPKEVEEKFFQDIKIDNDIAENKIKENFPDVWEKMSLSIQRSLHVNSPWLAKYKS